MPRCMRCMGYYEQQEYCPYCGENEQERAADRGQLPREVILNRRFIIGDVKSRDRIGFTYLAWDALLERRVVIKEWFPVKLAERGENHMDVEPSMSDELWKELNEGFLEQAKKLHRLQEISSLVPVYTFFRENNTSYYVMEDVEGKTLREMLQRQNPLESAAAQEIMKDIRQGLLVLHEKGLVHGNLSPDNVLLDGKGGVRFLNPAWYSPEMKKIKYTVFLGKYAPFSYYEKEVSPDKQMDVYGAAAIYYRILSGEEPVGAGQRRKKEKLPAISEYGIEIPPKLEKEILRDMEAAHKGRGFLRILQGLNVLLAVTAAVLGALLLL